MEIKKEVIDKIWEESGMDKALDEEFGDKATIELTKKELKDFMIALSTATLKIAMNRVAEMKE